MHDGTRNSGYGSAGMGYMDGAYLPLSEMRLPVTDMGFQLGDMCYDAIHVYKGRFFRLKDHLDRWEHSVSERRYSTLGLDREQVAEVLNGCVARAGLTEAMVTFVATRGSPSTAHKDLRTCTNRFMVWAQPYYTVISGPQVDTGSDIVVSETVRIPPEAVDPTIKNFGRLDFVRALFEAYDRDANYAILLDQDGNLTEGRGWNIFVLADGTLMSPDRGVLEGITRKTVVELAQTLNVDCRLTKVPVKGLREADEVFITSTAGGVMPVRSIDKKLVGDGLPGPVTMRIRDMYWKLHEDPAYSTPVRYNVASAA
jgi:branched-subunit amino acid aminotransferase/4-amino-4-deoxychorismate lyase